MVRVKICGIADIETARAAISYGADMLGFHVGEVKNSRNIISAEQATEIISQLPPSCTSVLVTTSSNTREVTELARALAVKAVQFHGSTTPEDIQKVIEELPYLKTYKAIHAEDGAIDEAKKYEGIVDAIILDSANKETGQVGGTGKTHDWNISRKIVETIKIPVILAGGLNPENVAEAIQAVRPYAVDVNSGVSNPDGTKNLEKVKLFITASEDPK